METFNTFLSCLALGISLAAIKIAYSSKELQMRGPAFIRDIATLKRDSFFCLTFSISPGAVPTELKSISVTGYKIAFARCDSHIPIVYCPMRSWLPPEEEELRDALDYDVFCSPGTMSKEVRLVCKPAPTSWLSFFRSPKICLHASSRLSSSRKRLSIP